MLNIQDVSARGYETRYRSLTQEELFINICFWRSCNKKNIFIAIFLSVHQVSICFAKIENVGAL